ncbi:MAG: class II glutamine amidotransferase [Beijerinckiaceae bacterium]|jgi:glutamine amidotransferase
MCRFLAYRGEPVFMEDLISAPAHSLVHQSLHAEEAKTGTNGDGFGVGWYGDKPMPGLYREVHPAWSDENLKSLCTQVRSSLFFAHVRAATGTATTRANCHPFTHGQWMFMHNGQIGGWPLIRRKVESLIPDEFYGSRTGTTDSEALFLVALSNGLEHDPVHAMARTLSTVRAIMLEAGITEPLRFAAALTDGQHLYAFRWASDDKPPTLYWRERNGALLVVSEPIDHTHEGWEEIPHGCALEARAGQLHKTRCLNEAMAQAA